MLSLAGHLKADFSINQQALTALTATFNKLGVKDTAGRIKIQGGVGTINWSNDEIFNQPSDVRLAAITVIRFAYRPIQAFIPEPGKQFQIA